MILKPSIFFFFFYTNLHKFICTIQCVLPLTNLLWFVKFRCRCTYTDNTAQAAAAAQWQTWRSTCLHFKTKYGNVHKMDYSNPFYNSRMVAYRYLSCSENVSTVHFYCYKFFIKKHFLHWFMQKIDSVDYFWKLQTVSFLNLFSQWAYYKHFSHFVGYEK